MKHWEFFSWFKPAVEDFHYERDAKNLHIKKRIIDLTGGGTGILKGVDDEIEVYVANPAQFLEVKVKNGAAYIQGEKIEIGSEQTVTLDDVETEANIVYLKYKLIDSSDPDAIRNHPITGEPHVVWKVDSFELIAVKESQYVQTDDKLKLARVAKVGSDLTVTHDYRSFLKIDGNRWPNYVNESEFYVGGPEGTGTKVLKQQTAPPIPNHLDLSTGWDDVYRKTGESAGLISHRPAYIKAEFGDKGQGTASGNTFTKTSNRVGDWTIDEWVNYYLTCSDGNSWKVVSNTADTLTLGATAIPINGNFWLGPDAAGYKLIIETLDPTTEEIVATAEAEAQAMASPVKMEFIWHGLTADVKYQVKVASKGGWFQEEWSSFCTPVSKIAGGPKELPGISADVLDGDATISAQDDGIRVSWSVKSEYVSKVSGFEFCWTDDGSSTPDFDNKNHRKVFTDRNFIVLPAKMSSETAPVTVKSKMRAVDKAGRPCITPKTLDDTNAKKYPADLALIVTDRKNILTPGGFGTMKDFLAQSINIDDGRGKMVSEMESEMADLRGTYATAGKRIDAILEAAVDWGYVRIVAKSGGYASIQAAVNSVVTNDFHLILIMPGVYVENITISDAKDIGFMGWGHVRIIGSITPGDPTGYVSFMDNIEILPTTAVTSLNVNVSRYGDNYSLFNNIRIRSGVINGPVAIITSIVPTDIVKVIVRNSYFKATGSQGYGLKLYKEMYAEIKGCGLDSQAECLHLNSNNSTMEVRSWDNEMKVGPDASYCATGPAYGNKPNLFMADCHYNKSPDTTNLICDFGSIVDTTNVLFDDADLEVLI